MQNLLDDLKTLLSGDDRLLVDGELMKNKVIELALQLDQGLLKLLLSRPSTKKHFFQDVGGVLVFDKIKFQRFVINKTFLPDSYTSFKNKIGLINEGGDYLSESKEIVLAWPYKDCVLEGGQTKDDQKRDEIFWNEVLAPDEIDRLLEPKVITSFRKYDKKGESTVSEVTLNNNFIIKGNNLLVLHCLKKILRGKVKLIYIDPPYNTGNDSFGYNDKFNHSTWLTFMKNRLEAARELLADDGSIYVQIDNNEIHYLKVLMDEVFGSNNFQREIIWVLKGVSGYKSLINNYVRGHDTILFYSKSKSFQFNKLYLPYSKEQLARFSSVDKDGRKYKVITKDKAFYLDEAKGLPISDVWDDIASFQTVVNSPEITGFDTQKPEKLIERIISASTDIGDLVLDFQLGSGTTCAVAHKMGRKYIGIEQMDYVNTVTIDRLKKVIAGEQGGISRSVKWQGGGSFIYCELAKANQEFIDKIQAAKTARELKTIWTKMQERAFISYKVDIKSINDSADSFDQLSLEDQKRFLVEIFDKNLLYINLAEIEDKDYKISKEDKALNLKFYSLK